MVPVCGSEAEGPEGVEEAGGVLQMHIVPGRASLAVAALKEQDFLRDTGRDGRGEATFASRDAGEAANVRAAGPENATKCVGEHLIGDGRVGGDRETVWPVLESRKKGNAVGAALGRVALLGA